MKKVLVLAAAIALFATPAMAASIVNSKHDLSAGSTATVKSAANFDRICAYCHTPHSADVSQGAPLWNRSSNWTVGANLYNKSETLTATAKAVNGAAFAGTDVILCMGCHDGNINTDGLVNPVGAGNLTPDDTNAPGAFTTTALLDETGTNLSNDHPVGFNFSAAVADEVASGDNGLNTLAQATGAGVKFYDDGAGNVEMLWCSSCHNVHNYGDTANEQPFLKTSNAGSALCLACHAK